MTYLSERINFGGFLITRGQALLILQAEGHPQHLIDAYMMGARAA